MAKKIFLIGFAMIILCLCCGICFAAEDNSISLGNEIVQSIDRTGESMSNVVSGNWTKDAGNTMNDMQNKVKDGENNIMENMDSTGSYNTVKTTAESSVATGEMGAMSTTTWMWIILVVAAIIIIAAIWYYATQNND